MGLFFSSNFHDAFGGSVLAYTRYGGPNVGDVAQLGKQVGDGDDSAFYNAWMGAGDRSTAHANDARDRGHVASAREFFFQASVFYDVSYRPLFGAPVDSRVVTAFDKAMDAFNNGIVLAKANIERVSIAFENATLPAYFVPAKGYESSKRPLVIFTNGYDATVIDMYFASAVAAAERGYHSLIFDGPGQGDVLVHQNVFLRPDWETVVSAVVDTMVEHPLVDEKAMALGGWSLGGYLALRAASGEPRLAACFADPPAMAITDSFLPLAVKMGAADDDLRDLGSLSDEVMDALEEVMRNDRRGRWAIFQRGFWTHGVDSVREYLSVAQQFTIADRVQNITCPTLLAVPDNDPLAAASDRVYDALTCPKTLIRFTDADGAAQHCEMGNRPLLNARVFDWLDDIFW